MNDWPQVRRALIRALRSNLELSAMLKGDWSEGVAPQGTPYPYGVISLIPAPILYDWTGQVVDYIVDVMVFAQTQGDAASIDQLVAATLQDGKLQVPELTVLSVRRTNEISLVDVDAEGKRVFESGGSYSIRVAQSAPVASSVQIPVQMTIS